MSSCPECSKEADAWFTKPCGHIFCGGCSSDCKAEATPSRVLCRTGTCQKPFQWGCREILRLHNAVDVGVKKLNQAKKNQHFWARRATRVKQTADTKAKELAEEQKRSESLRQQLDALRTTHNRTKDQLEETRYELLQLRESTNTQIEELMSSSQQSERLARNHEVVHESLIKHVMELQIKVQQMALENARLQGTTNPDLSEVIHLLKQILIRSQSAADSESDVFDSRPSSRARHAAPPHRRESVESVAESSSASEQLSYLTDDDAPQEPETTPCVPNVLGLSSFVQPTRAATENRRDPRVIPPSENRQPEAGIPESRNHQFRSETPTFAPPATPVRGQSSNSNPAVHQVVETPRRYTANVDPNNLTPKRPVAAPETLCKNGRSHSAFVLKGSNKHTRKYTCEVCKYSVREHRDGELWVSTPDQK